MKRRKLSHDVCVLAIVDRIHGVVLHQHRASAERRNKTVLWSRMRSRRLRVRCNNFECLLKCFFARMSLLDQFKRFRYGRGTYSHRPLLSLRSTGKDNRSEQIWNTRSLVMDPGVFKHLNKYFLKFKLKRSAPFWCHMFFIVKLQTASERQFTAAGGEDNWLIVVFTSDVRKNKDWQTNR